MTDIVETPLYKGGKGLSFSNFPKKRGFKGLKKGGVEGLALKKGPITN